MRGTSVMVLLCAALGAVSGCGDDGAVVVDGDAGRDAGNGDGGGGTDDVADDVDTGPVLPPVGEQLHVVYVREATSTAPGLPDYRQVMVVDESCRASNADLCEPGSCAPVEIAPRTASEPLCRNGCAVSGDLGHIVFSDPNTPSSLRVAPLGSDFQLSADSSVLSNDVSDYQLRQSTLAYRTGDDVRVRDLRTGDDRSVATLASSVGGFALSDDATRLFVHEVNSLTAMSTSVVDLATGNISLLYQFVSGELQGTGSFYSGREPVAVSPDGTRVAIVTDGRTSSFQCTSNADCTSPGETCLTSGLPPRCVKQELALHVINLAEAVKLGQTCASDVDCGAHHFCDLTSLDSSGAGECRPGRFSLGPSGPTRCASLVGGQYSSLRGQLAWRSNDTVMAVLGQDCIRGNIPVTDLVALNLSSGTEAFERVIENPGVDHGGCFSDVEGCWDPDGCVIEITTAAVSPSGQTVAFIADSLTSPFKDELWLIDAWGRRGKQILTRSIDYDILSVSVHGR